MEPLVQTTPPGKRRATVWKTFWKGRRGYNGRLNVIAKNKAERLRVKNLRRKANGQEPLTSYAAV